MRTLGKTWQRFGDVLLCVWGYVWWWLIGFITAIASQHFVSFRANPLDALAKEIARQLFYKLHLLCSQVRAYMDGVFAHPSKRRDHLRNGQCWRGRSHQCTSLHPYAAEVVEGQRVHWLTGGSLKRRSGCISRIGQVAHPVSCRMSMEDIIDI